MPPENTVLKLENLSVTVTMATGEERPLLRGVNLSLRSGRSTAIVGKSGSGKTTLAKAVSGLLPSTMRAEGTQTSLGLIGYMYQDAGNALNPLRRAIWQVEEARRALGVPKNRRRTEALKFLTRAEVPDVERYARRYPHQLSGGLAQRVLLAAVLAAEPSVLIVDEPTSALDVTTQARIAGLLRRLVIDQQIAVMLITHDLTVAAQIADDIAVMYHGEIVEHGTVSEVFQSPQHDYTRALVAALPERARPSTSGIGVQ